MKQLLFCVLFAAYVLIVLASCSKQAVEVEEFKSETSNRPSVSHATKDIFYPIVTQFNPCTQEYINFSGSIHIKVGFIIDGIKALYTVHLNNQNIRGVGQITGAIYKSVETYTWMYKVDKTGAISYKERAMLKYISPGNNFTLCYDLHFTIAIDGATSIKISDLTVKCK